jgi:hypothetical protein
MKEGFGMVSAIFFLLFIGVGYINNIIWMLDSWAVLGFGTKFFNITGIFVPPLGGFLGIYHFFN